MKFTHVFDDTACRTAKPFTREEITDALLQNENWRKDKKKKSYVYNCIRDRVRRGRIEDLGGGRYKWKTSN